MNCTMDLSSNDSVLVTGEFEIDGISLLPGQSIIMKSYKESDIDAGLYDFYTGNETVTVTGVKLNELKDKEKIVKIRQ